MMRLRWDQKRLREYQEKSLRKVIRYAYDKVPFYRERFRRAGASPNEIRTLDDLAKLPVIHKQDLRQAGTACISVDYRIQDLKVLTTSGSSGTPFRFYVSGAENDWRKAIYMRANVSCGQGPRDRWVVITGPRHFWDTTSIQRRLGIYAQRCISVFDGAERQLKSVREADPDILDGYSGSLQLLAQEVERQQSKEVRPRLIFGSVDLIDPSRMRYLEKVFGAPYHDQFGCSEVDRTAWQCPLRSGYHMDVDSVITQFVDGEGEDVSAGESGEIVYTSLYNFAMPFIRYSVGDIGRPSDDLCACGRSLPLMEIVEGRKDSLVVLPRGQTISPRTLTVAMNMFDPTQDLEQFRIIQRRPDSIDVYMKTRGPKPGEEDLEKRLNAHFTRYLNLLPGEVRFNVRLVEEIPLSRSGKLMSVVSELKPP